VLDVERLCAKVATGRAHARDLVGLAASLAAVAPLRAQARGLPLEPAGELLRDARSARELVARIRATLVDDPPLATREGGLVRPGSRASSTSCAARGGRQELDGALPGRGDRAHGHAALKSRLQLGLRVLPRDPRGQVERVPEHYVRKQTVKNAERYITPELKEHETKVLQRRGALARRSSHDLRRRCAPPSRRDPAHPGHGRGPGAGRRAGRPGAARGRAALRAPDVDEGDVIRIADGATRSVERMPGGGPFVPNDSRLNRSDR
jgi:DNA mismatch repair protein MutS